MIDVMILIDYWSKIFLMVNHHPSTSFGHSFSQFETLVGLKEFLAISYSITSLSFPKLKVSMVKLQWVQSI